MAGKVKVILNTYGGRLAIKAKISRVEQGLREAGVSYHLAPTNGPGHGVELARQASLEGWPIVVAAGGDGTINEVVNGLIQAAGEAEAGDLGIIPMGTANDLVNALESPLDIKLACQRIAAGNTRLMDIGQVNDHYFANNSAVGLEPMVTIAQDRIRWLKGDLRYVLAAFKTIIRAKTWTMRISWNNGQYEGPIILVSVGNGCRTGGSFFMTPYAVLDDGLIDFTYAVGMRRWQMLHLLPQTFSGKHIYHPLVVCRQTTALSITTSTTTPIQADGEIIERRATKINYRIIPRKLRVIV